MELHISEKRAAERRRDFQGHLYLRQKVYIIIKLGYCSRNVQFSAYLSIQKVPRPQKLKWVFSRGYSIIFRVEIFLKIKGWPMKCL